MFLPRKFADYLERLLPSAVSRALHRLYDPYLNWQVGRLNQRVLRKLFPDGKLVVLGGPFAGTKYLPLTWNTVLIPKLTGTYEQELHPAVEQFLKRDYRAIINIGCSEGYYLIGAGLRIPKAFLHGFDLHQPGLELCKKLAELNGVTPRLTLHEGCTVDALVPLVGAGTLVICDCEGGEIEFLDPVRVPGLRQADLLVELHDRVAPGVTTTIQKRFSPTHRIKLFASSRFDPDRCPALAGLNEHERRFAIEEFRDGPMNWVSMEAFGS